MNRKTSLTEPRARRVQSFLNALPDWTFIDSDPLRVDAKWTTAKGVWHVVFSFPTTMGMGGTCLVSGRGLEMKYSSFDDDDVQTIIAMLSMIGALQVREVEE